MRDKHITSAIIADSLSPQGERLTSFIVTCPRIVLAEFNTHRMLSRNSASSRAIPFNTMVAKVMETPFIPIRWQADHSGMQGNEYLSGRDVDLADGSWLRARNYAVQEATMLNKNINVTKQFCNRLLEPYLYHTIIVTASEWQNFLALRAHDAAEIHIQNLAYKMLEDYNKSTPIPLKAGEWHVPFGGNFDEERLDELFSKLHPVQPASMGWSWEAMQKLRVKIAIARCARVSYLNYEGENNYEKDIILHDRLSKMGHWSPFEHCARAMSDEEHTSHTNTYIKDDEVVVENGWSGNFRGFIQYRKMFNGENKKDSRVI